MSAETILKSLRQRGLVAGTVSKSSGNSKPVQVSNTQTPPVQCAKTTRESAPVFISYQSAFTERALKIKRALEARGIACWMATEDMVGDVQDAIGEALMVAPAILICYSQSYRQSKYNNFLNCFVLSFVCSYISFLRQQSVHEVISLVQENKGA